MGFIFDVKWTQCFGDVLCFLDSYAIFPFVITQWTEWLSSIRGCCQEWSFVSNRIIHYAFRKCTHQYIGDTSVINSDYCPIITPARASNCNQCWDLTWFPWSAWLKFLFSFACNGKKYYLAWNIFTLFHIDNNKHCFASEPVGNLKNAYNVWVRYLVWNFKGYIWNATQNIWPIHLKVCNVLRSEIFRAPRFMSLLAFLMLPLVPNR